MLSLNGCIRFIYLLVCFNVISSVLSTPPQPTTSTTSTPATTTKPTSSRNDIPQTEESTLSNNKSRPAQNDPLMRLTQMMAVQLEGKSEGVKSVLKDIIHGEVEQILKEFDKSVQSVPLDLDKKSSCSKDTLLVLLDNLAREVTNLRSSVGFLKSEIDLWKSNNRSNTASRVYLYESALKPLSKKTPIGVNYDPVSKVDEDNTAHRKVLPRDCDEVREQGNNKSGVYKIQPRTSRKPFMVLCDMETRGGGWVHIQKRFDGSQDFYLDWRDYKFGFGDLDGEFWLGLENIYSLVGSEVSELLVELVDRDNITAYAHYKAFGIGPEADGYPLNVLRGFSGDAGDSLVQHFNSKFSTKDFDQDENESNCAQLYLGGWWYKSCHVSNLNGKFMNAVLPKHHKFQGMHWITYRGHEYCHAKSRMMVRPARLV